eukprot:TRINITY_DN5522_c0_g1_i8.p1 TRINITY_DN5522_c0_g1~~TRINITY_DN5522_c0_g1_i8.p1  ORF type:complete len:416 (-),score=70.30 TRINITY_DN5522_c0_g1_i8:225-1337(-)
MLRSLVGSEMCIRDRSYTWYFGKCPLRPADQAVHQLRHLLGEELSGQKVAAGQISTALSSNIYSKRRRPLAFHFSGPTGVGKSLCSSLVARALFSDTSSTDGPICGLVHHSMRSFEHRSQGDDLSRLQEAKEQIEKEIALQLESCPRSIIILDDIERLSSRFLDFLQGLLSPNFPAAAYWKEGKQKMVSTKDAVFILISDLNEDKLSPDISHKAAIRLIRQKAKDRWSDSKVVALIENTVPFVPLTDDEMKQVAERSLTTLEHKLIEYSVGAWKGKLAWGPKVPGNIIDAARRERPDENARAVTSFVDVEVRDQLFEILDRALQKSKHLEGYVFTSFIIHVDQEGEVKVEPYGLSHENPPNANPDRATEL